MSIVEKANEEDLISAISPIQDESSMYASKIQELNYENKHLREKVNMVKN